MKFGKLVPIATIMVFLLLAQANAADTTKRLTQDAYDTLSGQIGAVWKKAIYPTLDAQAHTTGFGSAILVLVPKDGVEFTRTFEITREFFPKSPVDRETLYTIRVNREKGWAVGYQQGVAKVFPVSFGAKPLRKIIHFTTTATPDDVIELLDSFCPEDPEWMVGVFPIKEAPKLTLPNPLSPDKAV